MELSQEILQKLTKRTIKYINEDLALGEVSQEFEIDEVDKLDLLDISTMIALSGSIKGTVGLSVSNELAFKMVEGFIYGEMAQSELEELASENVAETLNIVLGNILSELDSVNKGEIIDISTPYTLHNSVSITKKKNGKMYLSILQYKDEKILLSYFI